MWTFVGWETESVWGTLWLNFLSRELPGTSINNTATPLRLTPHTQRQFLFLKDFFQHPALKAVLHIATCNCLGPVRQVIKTIEKCAVALHLPDNLFLICVNRNFDTALPSSKNICQTKMPMRESYACVVFVFSMISTQIIFGVYQFIHTCKKDSWKVVQCLHREPIGTSIYWSLSPLDCGNAWLMDSHHRCNCRRTTLSSCSSLLISTTCLSNVSNWSSSCGWLESIKNGAKCPEVCEKLNVEEELMIFCNTLNAKHRMQSIFCKIHFNWTKKSNFQAYTMRDAL